MPANYDLPAIDKLLVLFVIDKMAMSVTENTLIEMCTVRNDWVSYMDCSLALEQLVASQFLFRTTYEKEIFYSITTLGRECIASFYHRISPKAREQISDFIKRTRMSFRRRQQYFNTYKKNEDGSYTAILKIKEPTHITLELNLNVATRATAKAVCKKWEEKASDVFYSIYELLID